MAKLTVYGSRLFFPRTVKNRFWHMAAYTEKSSVLCEQVNYFLSFWNTYLLLTEFEDRTARTVSYGPSFFLINRAWAINRRGKNEDP